MRTRPLGLLWLVLVVAGLGTAGPGHAADITFDLPVACEMGVLCTIQKYVDHDPGPGRVDYGCGRLSLDGDTGTDFRVPDYPAMERGVAVIASAPGVVKGVRDSMADISVREIGQVALANRFAGNGVVIDHGDGWETQYSHLKRGSIAVRQGDRVVAGQRLGLIGLSGNTEFPHVEFSVRFDGDAGDPFVGRVPFNTCTEARAPLWSVAALAQLAYTPTGPLTAGFTTGRAEADAARKGAYAAQTISTSASALVFWVDIYGALAGDVQGFAITDPTGRVIHERANALDANNISWFAFSGLRRPAAGWVLGDYEGRYELVRDGATVLTARATVRLE